MTALETRKNQLNTTTLTRNTPPQDTLEENKQNAQDLSSLSQQEELTFTMVENRIRKHIFLHEIKPIFHNQIYGLSKNCRGLLRHWPLNRIKIGIWYPQAWPQRQIVDQILRQGDRPTITRSTDPYECRRQHNIFHPPITSTQAQDPILHSNLCQSIPTQVRTTTIKMNHRCWLDQVKQKSKHTTSRTYHRQSSCEQHHLHAQFTLDGNGHQILYLENLITKYEYVRISVKHVPE